MKKLFLTICLTVIAISCAHAADERLTPSSANHPIQMPVTLLDLYRRSDAIFEARFDRVNEDGVVKLDQDYTVVRVKKLFDVYTTLKGSSSKFVSLSEDEYRYPEANPQAKYLLAKYADEENTYGLRSGDSVLLFLKFGPDGKTLELADDEEGLKKLSSNDIDVYERRIRELDGLLSGDKPSAQAIVEWMMRCAEEPATRWEATFELIKGFEKLDYQHRQGSEDAENTDLFDSTTFARALTEDQKHRLADILFTTQQPQVGEDGKAKRTYVRGDRELIDLVKQWGDPRLAPYLLNELKNKELNDYRRSETMHLIAGMLGDRRITGLADDYASAYRNEGIAEQLFYGQEQPASYKSDRADIMAKFIKLANSSLSSPER